MSGLRTVTRFEVPPEVVAATDRALRAAGREGYECFVLWTGHEVGTSFVVDAPLVPPQHAVRSEDGVGVIVGGDAMHVINRWLVEHHHVLGAQIHSHPTDAYHSETDDSFPIVNETGGISIVVPDYGERGLRGGGVAVLRLTSAGWREVPEPVLRELLPLFEEADAR